MERRSIFFKPTGSTLGTSTLAMRLYVRSYSISPAPLKTQFVDIPDGSALDISEVFGHKRYGMRDFSAECTLEPSITDPLGWIEDLRHNFFDTFDGSTTMALPEPADVEKRFEYTGRFWISDIKRDGQLWNITISGKVYPIPDEVVG